MIPNLLAIAAISGALAATTATRAQVLLIAQPLGGVARFDMINRAFLPTWDVPGQLRAIDITRDGSRVVVADGDSTRSGSNFIGRVHVINSETGVNNPITWRTGGGVGAQDVVVTSDDRAFVTPRLRSGAGREILREINLNTRVVRTAPGSGNLFVETGSGLRRNQSGSHLFFWQGNTDGPQSAIYTVSQNTATAIGSRLIYGGISPDGTRVAANHFGNMDRDGLLTDNALQTLLTLPGESVLTYTFDPIRPLIYFADRTTGDFVTLSSTTGEVLLRTPSGYSFDGAESLELSDNGYWAFVRTNGGVVAIAIPSPGPAVTACLALGGIACRRRRR